MSKLRWLRLGALMLLSAGTGSLATQAVQVAQRLSGHPPPIARDLPGRSWEERSANFTARLLSKFPPGSSEGVLKSELIGQRFRADWPIAAGEQAAVYTWSTPVCAMVARVRWRTDGQDHITNLEGVYREEGCL